jgi:hypothetical protein
MLIYEFISGLLREVDPRTTTTRFGDTTLPNHASPERTVVND